MTDSGVDREFENILIIKPSAAGDIVCALPILAALRRRYGGARISWLVSAHLAELLKGHPFIDEVIEFDRRRFGYMARSWSVTRRFMKFLQGLRSAGYDLVIDLQGLFRSGFLAWTTQAGVRIGPAEKRELGWVFYTHRCPMKPLDTHTVDRMCAVGEVLNMDMAEPQFMLPVTDQARQSVGELLKQRRGGDVGQYLVIAPGGTWPAKRWPVTKFAQLANRVVDELGLTVVIAGGRAERQLADEMLGYDGGRADGKIVSSAGETSLSQLLAVLEGAVGVVSNDSGPMHMAVALDRAVTAIIGPTNAHRTGPYRRSRGIVASAMDCSPCYKRHCPLVADGEDAKCMAEISVDEVFENLTAQIAGADQRR